MYVLCKRACGGVFVIVFVGVVSCLGHARMSLCKYRCVSVYKNSTLI